MIASEPPSYGVKVRSPAEDHIDAHAEEIRLVGYTVLESGLSASEAGAFRERIDRVIEKQEREIGGADVLASIGETNTGRALLAYDESFLSLAANPRLLDLVGRVLDDYFILSQQNSIVLQPDKTHNQAQWHRDLPYQHFVSSRPIALNALFCVDPFTLENGSTHIIPGSHKYEPFPCGRTIDKLEHVTTAPAGSYIVLDAMLYHRSGANRTSSPRSGVNHVFTLPFMRQQIDLPRMLAGRYSENAAIRRLLGYDVETPTSVVDWRNRRPRKP